MRRHRPLRRFAVPRIWLLLAGLETGVIAGIAILLYWMLATTVRGEGPWLVPNLMGSALFPGRDLSLRFSYVSVSGAALHVLLSGLVGVIASIILGRYVMRPIRSLWIGMLIGFVWYLAAFRWLWPWLGRAVVIYQPFPTMVFGHVLFGLLLGLYPVFVRRLRMSRAPARDSPFL